MHYSGRRVATGVAVAAAHDIGETALLRDLIPHTGLPSSSSSCCRCSTVRCVCTFYFTGAILPALCARFVQPAPVRFVGERVHHRHPPRAPQVGKLAGVGRDVYLSRHHHHREREHEPPGRDREEQRTQLIAEPRGGPLPLQRSSTDCFSVSQNFVVVERSLRKTNKAVFPYLAVSRRIGYFRPPVGGTNFVPAVDRRTPKNRLFLVFHDFLGFLCSKRISQTVAKIWTRLFERFAQLSKKISMKIAQKLALLFWFL